MTTLELGYDRYILRDDLEAEDLICVLDLLRDARRAVDYQPIDVKVGFAHPQPPHPSTQEVSTP